MIGAVSGVNFRGAATQEAQSPFSRPGKYSASVDELVIDKPKKKKGGFFKALGITLLVAGAVAAGLAFGQGKIFKVLDKEALKNAKFYEKAGHYLGVAGENIAKCSANLWAKMPWVKKAATTVAS